MNINDHSPHAILSIHVNGDTDLVNKYSEQIEKHNNNMFSNEFPDSGFDLLVPDDTIFNTAFKSQMIDLNIICEMKEFNLHSNNYDNSGFFVFPRSSISKTPLLLANHTGIIDSGYRGNIKAAFRYLPFNDNTSYTAVKHQRLLQICHPSLSKIFVKIVSHNELMSTERGSGGFGSTGI